MFSYSLKFNLKFPRRWSSLTMKTFIFTIWNLWTIFPMKWAFRLQNKKIFEWKLWFLSSFCYDVGISDGKLFWIKTTNMWQRICSVWTPFEVKIRNNLDTCVPEKNLCNRIDAVAKSDTSCDWTRATVCLFTVYRNINGTRSTYSRYVWQTKEERRKKKKNIQSEKRPNN